MKMTIEQFEDWYAKPIESLCEEPHGGIVALIAAIPLAERFFRQTSQRYQQSGLDDNFHSQLICRLCPDLGPDDADKRAVMEKLWQCLRDGLMHQASFNHQNNRVRIYITRKGTGIDNLVQYKQIDQQTKEFVIDPRGLARMIVQLIRADFDAFRAEGAKTHPLLVESEIPAWATSFLNGDKQTGATGCS